MRKAVIRAAYLCLALVLALSLYTIVRSELQLRRSASDTERAQLLAGLVMPTGEQPDAELPEWARALMGIDLEVLRQVNGDVAGWITIPGTDLSCPIMQGEDNDYYLTRSWTGEENIAGAIFFETACSTDLAGYNTIVYGHRMRDGSMFGLLKYYKEPDFLKEHPSVYLAVDGSVCRYQVFAAFEADLEGMVYRLDIEKKHLEKEFLQYCIDNSVIETGAVPEDGERVLTLSTCTGFGHARRWVVLAALREEYQRERSLT